jgi:hypothetical protein
LRYATQRARRREVRKRKVEEGEDLARRWEGDVDVLEVIGAFRRLVGANEKVGLET